MEFAKVWKSDVVYIWFADYPALPFVVWAKLFGKPCVVNIGGWEVVDMPEIKYGNQRSPIRGFATRWIVKNTSVNITPSEPYCKKVEILVPGSKVITIPNFVDSELCDGPLPIKKNQVITSCCAESAYVSKGIPTFLEATSGGSYTAMITAIANRSVYEQTLKESKVYCQLSYEESFGVSLLEAMACGCIPVVSDRGALPWLVGECGIVVPRGDVKATRNAIELALRSGAADIASVRNRARFFNRERKKELQEKMLEEVCSH